MSAAAPPAGTFQDADEQRLAELGYKQELNRSWSGFQNFAISFTIISILAGCFTTYGQAWNNGGPVAISWGWPIISAFILIIGFCMSELVSAYPTAGGIYWWAAKMGGPVWGWFTGWFNLIGLIAVTASVDYGAALFLNTVFGAYKFNGFNALGSATAFYHGTFFLFLIILAFHVLVNIAGSHLVARINGVSVWWHVAGVAIVIGALIFVPVHHESFKFVFTQRFNNSGLFGGGHSNIGFWFYVLPLGFLLTQYTITGYDSCAHISEETHGAADSAAKGVWRSIFYSAIFGYVLLLAITFAVQNVGAVNKDAAGGAYVSVSIIQHALTGGWFKAVIIISTVGQIFCGAACLTSASRMCYAFSRDGAIPGWRFWSKLNSRRVPARAVVLMATLGAIITVPAYFPSNNGGVYVPVAFYAVVSIAVIGLYIAYVIPIFLRWRQGAAFQSGPWTLGNKYKWMNPIAVAEVIIVTIVFILPTLHSGVPWNNDFTWKSVNYAPLVTGVVILAVAIWWMVSARHTFTGPRHTISELDAELGELPGSEPAPQTAT
jgi:amino acid transporter